MFRKWIPGAAATAADAARNEPPDTRATVPVAPEAALAPPPGPARGKPIIPGLTEVVIKPSVLSDAISICGDIRTKGALHIDGHASGTIEAGSVTVGTGGIFEGTVRCGKLHIKGIFSGNGSCGELILGEEAQVAVGSLTYRTIAVHRGARLAGDLVRIEPEAPG